MYKRPCSFEQAASLGQPATPQSSKLKVHLSKILVQVHYCSSPVEYRTSLLADLSDKSEGGKRKGDRLVKKNMQAGLKLTTINVHVFKGSGKLDVE